MKLIRDVGETVAEGDAWSGTAPQNATHHRRQLSGKNAGQPGESSKAILAHHAMGMV